MIHMLSAQLQSPFIKKYDRAESCGRCWYVGDQLVGVIRDSISPGLKSIRFGESERALWVVDGDVIDKTNFLSVEPSVVVDVALSGLENVSRRYWGMYLILIFDKVEDRFSILSDPCGQRSLFYRCDTDGGIHIAGSIKDLIDGKCILRQIDQRYVAQYLAYGHGDAESTGWAGVSVLVPGSALTWKRGERPKAKRVWRPGANGRDARRDGVIELLADAVAAALDPSKSIVLELSGGIDSSALAVALRRAQRHEQVSAVTYFDRHRAASNELAIARDVATRCGITHAGYPLHECLPFSKASLLPLVSRPATNLCFVAQQRHLALLGLGANGDLVVNGHGGDSLYLDPPPFSAIFDALASGKFLRSVSALRDLSIYYRVPIWLVLRNAFAEAFCRFSAWNRQGMMSVVRAVQDIPRGVGVYDDVLSSWSYFASPARRCQIAALGEIIDDIQVNIGVGDSGYVMPYLFQPVVDHALSMEVEDIFSADYARLPVRKSVDSYCDLPSIWRVDKGDIMHSALCGIKVNERHVRELCLDGWSVSSGIVDASRLDRLIRRAALGYDAGLAEIVRVYSVEIFCCSMHGAA